MSLKRKIMFSPGVTCLLEGGGPFVGNFYDHDNKREKRHISDIRVLVAGAGGLGCEILKSLTFNGFKHIDIVDMDTIDISNINRQYLFRAKDVGRYKSEVAAEYIKNRVHKRFETIKYTNEHGEEIEDDIEINFKTCAIQELPNEYFMKFHIIIGGFDNMTARNWLSEKLVEISQKTNNQFCIPYIDGGIGVWVGNIFVMYPNKTACFECIENIYRPKPKIIPDTICINPRNPAQALDIVYNRLWDFKEPFDANNEKHINYLIERTNKLLKSCNLEGEIDQKFVKDTLSPVDPVIACTPALIASMCCTEALKIASDCAPFLCKPLNHDQTKYEFNSAIYYGNSEFGGVTLQAICLHKNDECRVCSNKTQTRKVSVKIAPDEIIGDFLKRMEGEAGLANAESIFKADRVFVCPFYENYERKLKMKMSDLGYAIGDHVFVSSPNDFVHLFLK